MIHQLQLSTKHRQASLVVAFQHVLFLVSITLVADSDTSFMHNLSVYTQEYVQQ